MAQDAHISETFARDIESRGSIPSERVIWQLSRAIRLDFDTMMWLAGRAGESVDAYAARRLRAGAIFRQLAAMDLDDEELLQVQHYAEKIFDSRDAKRADAEEDN